MKEREREWDKEESVEINRVGQAVACKFWSMRKANRVDRKLNKRNIFKIGQHRRRGGGCNTENLAFLMSRRTL